MFEDAAGAGQQAGLKVQQTKVGRCTNLHVHHYIHTLFENKAPGQVLLYKSICYYITEKRKIFLPS